MLKAKTVRTWYQVHKWTSLISTAFLLLMCITGLPLVFHHEIEHLLGEVEPPETVSPNAPKATLDLIVDTGKAKYQSLFLQYMVWDPDEPNALSLSFAPSATALVERTVNFDKRTGEILSEPKIQEGFIYTMLRLHTDMYAGLGGKLFLGIMGLLFVIAVISGVVVYGPFMRSLDFGTVRKQKGPRVKWFDLHNLLGIATVIWALVVGITGMINTWADLVIKYWQFDQLGAMVAPYKNKPPLEKWGSLDQALAVARRTAPDKDPGFVAFPGTVLSSPHHFAVFMRGKEPLTARLYTPVLVDAETGTLTDYRTLPWYVTALLVSQPLHFGDYGGLPLKIVWGLFDTVTIIVLASGLYLWLARRKSPIEEDLDALVEAERVKVGSLA